MHAERPMNLLKSTVKQVKLYKNGFSKEVVTGVQNSFVVSEYHAV